MIEFMRLTDAKILERMTSLLAGDAHASSRDVVERMWRLHRGTPDLRDADDRLLRASIDVWSWAHECSIVLGVEAVPGSVPALGLMRPSRKLIDAYDVARNRERRARAGG